MLIWFGIAIDLEMKNKKILHIPNFYPPHIGGIEDVCHGIISVTSDIGFEHQVMCFHDKPFTQVDDYKGIKVTRSGVVRKLFSQAISFSYRKELKAIFREFMPDIVHFHTPNPLASVYLLTTIPAQTKLILHWHSDVVAQSFLYFFYRPIEQMLLRRASKILVTSPTYISGSKALCQQNSEKLLVIPNTITKEKLQLYEDEQNEVEAIKKHYSNQKIVFFFGRHVPYKGLEHLIRGIDQLYPDTVVVIAGHGPLTERLQALAQGTNTHFVGRLSESQLRIYLHAADVFAFPSVTRNEAFGVALAEAMYCGLPAVTFTIENSGVNWVNIANETGLEVKNGDGEAFVEAINRLLKDDFLREHFGGKAKERASKLFVPEAIVNDIVHLYNNIDQNQ